MQLVRLSLKDWRGVADRDIDFADRVTVIEGPNEIGKSTIVEALQLLFRDLDTSTKAQVKAIQPAGQDVGSRVEAEIRAGANHFVFAKTYNRNKQTTLDILAPDKRQFTGREAHNEANRLLEDSVDMALWEALLVDQGDKIGLVDLQSSSSLAKALDDAAGVRSDEAPTAGDDSSLFTAMEKEYGEYFTLKTGQPRPGFAALRKGCESAHAALAEACARLAEVEETVAAYTQQATEVQRLREALPVLQQDLQKFDREWQRVQRLESDVHSARQSESAAAELLREAERALSERQRLQETIAATEQLVRSATDARRPLQSRFERAHIALTESQTRCVQQRKDLRAAERAKEIAEADVEYHQNQQELVHLGKLLALIEDINAQLVRLREQRAELFVDDAALERIRGADAALRLALGTRNAAATSVTVTALRPLTLEVDEARVPLDAAESTTRSVAAAMALQIPDVASIRIEPSRSVAELAEQVAQAEQALATLCQRFGVTELRDAVADNARLKATAARIEQLTARRSDVVQGADIEALLQSQHSLQTRCEGYAAQRHATTPLPANLAAAQRRSEASRAEYQAARKQLSATESALETLQADAQRLDGEVRKADVNLAQRNAALVEQRTALELAAAERDDAALEAEQQRKAGDAQQRRGALQALEKAFQEVNPEALKALRDNADAVVARAARDLAAAEQALASLSGQLVAAQADGRYEAFDAAEQKATALADELAVTEGRAAAAQRLWTTLNRHRNAARQAYVGPLKAAIESLGAIVFGRGFEVDVDDDWSIARRTLAGQTLPFADLSVGAREQLGILMRLAAAQLVSRDGGVPLIIDDALGFSDPARLQTMGAAIAAAGEHCQIIILTCTPGRFTHVGNAQVVRLSTDS